MPKAFASACFNWRNVLRLLGLAAGVMACASAAPAQDETRVRSGLDVWKNTGCPDCHGAFADGEKQRDEAPTGANLRQLRLDDGAIKETIRCGRPGTGMPSFGEGAYTSRGCNGQPAGPAPDGLYPASRTLSTQEIDNVVTYLRARVIGKRVVTPEECAYYYGETASVNCDPAN